MIHIVFRNIQHLYIPNRFKQSISYHLDYPLSHDFLYVGDISFFWDLYVDEEENVRTLLYWGISNNLSVISKLF